MRSLGCDLGQGYYFAKPLPAQLATAYLEIDLQTAAAFSTEKALQLDTPRLVLSRLNNVDHAMRRNLMISAFG